MSWIVRGVRGILKMMGAIEGEGVLETLVRRVVREVAQGGVLENQMLRSEGL